MLLPDIQDNRRQVQKMKHIYNVVVSQMNGAAAISNNVFVFESEQTAEKFAKFARRYFRTNDKMTMMLISNPQSGEMYSDADVEQIIQSK